MRVLVTGAGGFVGRALVPLLAARGMEVIALDHYRGLSALSSAATLHEGDIGDERFRRAALEEAEAVIHLATVPGGAAEEHPDLARRININATMALSAEFAGRRPGAPFVFSSSVAVFGDALLASVDDSTPVAPRMLYGAHKAMLETWLGVLGRRGELATLSLRLPGIVARPVTSSGMKSAFMSNLFHALSKGHPVELPVSPEATMWLVSVQRAAISLADGLQVAFGQVPESRAVTLPALRVCMGELVAEVARQCAADPALVRFAPDAAIEQDFGRQPPLSTPTAERMGFSHDGDLAQLVRSALQTLQ